MIRVGLVGCDTSHVAQFTMRLNHVEIEEEQWVDGLKVVAAWPGTSAVAEQQRIDEYTAKLAGWGVEIVDTLEQMLTKIDCVMIESNDGSVHLKLARPFIEAGMTTYIDKPFASSYADAVKLVDLAEKHNVSLFSSSSLRYAPEVQDFHAQAAEHGSVVGAAAWSPSSLHPRNPGMFHYGIHGVETLYAVMGPGCEAVWCVFEEAAEVTVGLWGDGRIGTMRGTRAGAHDYGFQAWCQSKVVMSGVSVGMIYRELLKRVATFFETGVSPLPIEETLEIAAFIEGALLSAQASGKRVELPGR
jgi:predicted dehydrogenase